jgi:hypothetical protein
VAVGELARGRQRSGAGEQKLDAILRWSRRWEQPQRRLEPARGAFRCEPCRCLARLAQNGDGRHVALARGPLDMMSARCGHALRRKRLRAAFVGAESPAAGGGVVHRTSDERMSKAEASRHVGCANQIEL